MNVTADDRVGCVAQQCAGAAAAGRAVIAEIRILSEGIGELHRLPVVDRVIDVDRHRASLHVAVVAPHQHLHAVDDPRVDAAQWMEVPARVLRVLGSVRDIVAAVAALDRHRPHRSPVCRC